MDRIGFEPMTSSMPWKRAPNCATAKSVYLVCLKASCNRDLM